MAKLEETRETASGNAAGNGNLGAGKSAGGGPRAGGALDGRRGFLVRLMAVVIGGLVTVFPFAAGLLVFADPWRRQAGGSRLVRVTSLDDLPDDGVPRRFSVFEDRVDAWNYYPNQAVGAIYLRRIKGHATPEALQATCPHAGCMLDYLNNAHEFRCPCHNSAFKPDGQIMQPSPAPRPMDTLVCKVIEHGGVKEVWVEFQNFYTGAADKIAKV